MVADRRCTRGAARSGRWRGPMPHRAAAREQAGAVASPPLRSSPAGTAASAGSTAGASTRAEAPRRQRLDWLPRTDDALTAPRSPSPSSSRQLRWCEQFAEGGLPTACRGSCSARSRRLGQSAARASSANLEGWRHGARALASVSVPTGRATGLASCGREQARCQRVVAGEGMGRCRRWA